MYAEERQQAIAALVISKGRASVAELAQTYDVTTETVRRDLAALDKAGVVRRVHGGAVPARALHLVEPGVGERESTRADYKDAIAAAAIDFFPLSGASCCWTRARRRRASPHCCPTDRDLLVVTNSVPIAARLAAMPTVSLQLLGGRVRGVTQAAVGEQALRVLDTLRVDIAFIGTNAISARHGLSTPDSEEAAVKRAMVAVRQLRRRRRRLQQGRPGGLRQLRADLERRHPHHRHRDRRRRPPRADRPAASRSSAQERPNDRHRHPEPEHRPHRHARHAADPRRGAPRHLRDQRTRRQGRQRRARPDTGRARRRRAAARRRRRPHRRRACAPAVSRSAACRSPASSGPTSPSPNPTAPQPNSTSPGAHLDDAGTATH